MSTSDVRPDYPSYQKRDWEIVDYQAYCLEGTGVWLRGPKPAKLDAGQYAVCLGAAQTYGCFCERPYPAILERRLGFTMLNLGWGGAGPLFFLRQRPLLDYVNRARFIVVQVMSARSEDNSVFESGGRELLRRRADGVEMDAASAYRAMLHDGRGTKLGRLWESVAHKTERRVRAVVEETRENWVRHFVELLKLVRVPRILFWFSKRSPTYGESYDRVESLFGEFPQMVNQAMIDAVRGHTDSYVECISSAGSPQLLRSRFTGQPTMVDMGDALAHAQKGQLSAYNSYYPSPEMHEAAAQALEVGCREWLG